MQTGLIRVRIGPSGAFLEYTDDRRFHCMLRMSCISELFSASREVFSVIRFLDEHHANNWYVIVTEITNYKPYYVFTVNYINLIASTRNARSPYVSQRAGLLNYGRLHAVREWWDRSENI
jgi:hypothetical protein